MFMSSTLRNFDHGKTINLYRHRFQDTGISTAKIPSFFQMYGNIHSPCTCSTEVQLVFVYMQLKMQAKTSCTYAERVQGS